MSGVYKQPQPNIEEFTCPHCYTLASQKYIFVSRRYEENGDIDIRRCQACKVETMWINSQLVYSVGSPPANADMHADVRRDYEEARSIAEVSSHEAGALRCSIKVDDLIHELESKGMSQMIADMNQSICFIGNNAVHPLELDLNEQPAW